MVSLSLSIVNEMTLLKLQSAQMVPMVRHAARTAPDTVRMAVLVIK